MKKLVLTLFFILLSTPSFSTNYCNDSNIEACWLMDTDENPLADSSVTDYTSNANCQGAWGMEDSGNESDLAGSEDLTETSGTIPQDSDHVYGAYSRDFTRAETEYLTVADGGTTDISGANQAISIVAWVNPDTNPSANMAVACKYSSDPNDDKQYCLYLYDNGGNLSGSFGVSSDGAAWTEAYGATTIPLDTWSHIAGVYNDTDIRFYLNGSVDTNGGNNPATYSSGISDEPSAFSVGTYVKSGTDANFDGLIDDVAIFDDALTATEVSDIWKNGVYEGHALVLKGAGEPDYLTADPPGSFSTGYYSCDGLNDYANVVFVSPIDLDEMSVVGWSFHDDTGSWDAMFSGDTGANSYGFSVDYDSSDQMNLYEQGSIPSFVDLFSITTVNEAWHHVAYTVSESNNRARLYIDGVLEANDTHSTTQTMANFALCGRTINGSMVADRYEDGKFDEVAIFSRELTGTEINEIKDSGLEGTVTPSTDRRVMIIGMVR